MTEQNVMRARHIASVRSCHEYQWLFGRLVHGLARDRFGQAGEAAVARGIRRYGYARGQAMFCAPEAFVVERDACSLLAHWQGPELLLASVESAFAAYGNAGEVTMRFAGVPGSESISGEDLGEFKTLFWPAFLVGLTAGYEETASVRWLPTHADPLTPWTVTWTFSLVGNPGPERDLSDVVPDPFERAETTIALGRRTLGFFAMLQMYVLFELVRAFGASGEELVRAAAFEFGGLRGQQIREQVVRAGKPLTFTSMVEAVNERDPYGALFVYRGDVHVSDGVFQGDCVYCPLAEAWATEGPDGLAAGYLLDMEDHRGLLESFHPGGITRWASIKTKGDPVCAFRMSIPELVTDQDPEEY